MPLTRLKILLLLPLVLAGCCGEEEPRPRRGMSPTASATPSAGTPARRPAFIEMVRIEPGKFFAVSADNTHEVEITRPFLIGKYEVTQREYEKVMGTNPSMHKGDRLPVENVSWDAAMEFCRRLSKMEGREYTLPTEAQWEFACRAGTKSKFHFGTAISADQVNFDPHGQGEYRRKTLPVGSFTPNAWGLYDMHGNVREWCADWFAEDYYKDRPDLDKDPTGPESGEKRVVRGGAFNSAANLCQSSYREGESPNLAEDNLGFRVVLKLP